MKKYVVLALACLLVAGLGLSCGPTKRTSTQDITLSSGEYASIPVNLNSGDLVEGSFTVQGPTNLDIAFAVQDPTGRNVYGPVRSRSSTFTYRAQMGGIHYLYLDNTYSLFTGKIVSVTYTFPMR